ncbi:carbohydrate sulfotransferase [Plakobranchus ocellatus]|uniref:Carbohydrate sulfotransferase n=1 Tax=Plakobranchus ocellatus TaxID=259542 RepID=A0AAV3YFI3_9GAST|nr:carbohydrate sulfotransferase [Plakobranchus ocellatus]
MHYLRLIGKKPRIFLAGVLVTCLVFAALRFKITPNEVLIIKRDTSVQWAGVSDVQPSYHDKFDLFDETSDIRGPDPTILKHPAADDSSSRLSLATHQSKPTNTEIYQRARHARQVCLEQPTNLLGISSEQLVFSRIEISQEWNYLFCPILKVGSTFLRRAFYSLDIYGKVTNPYLIPIERALKGEIHTLNEMIPLTRPLAKRFLSLSSSFLIVREPLSRLLSGYMDKLYAPNPFYWDRIGKYIVDKYRSEESREEDKCGSTVTFKEFLEYVADEELDNLRINQRDPHFTPAYDQCKVCALNYTLIGKMESFREDVYAIMHQIGLDVSQDQIVEWSSGVVRDAIMDSVESPFEWKIKVSGCISWYNSLRRVWRKLQTRGIIPLEEKFPWTEEEIERSITAEDFISKAHLTHLAADKASLKKQKKEVLAMAYSSVDKETIRKVLEAFGPDFDLFQYDKHPDFLFDHEFINQVVHTLPDIFDYENI